MPVEVLTHDLRQRRTPTLVLGVVLGALAFFIFSVAAGLGDAVAKMTKNLPVAMSAFIGTDAPGGYVVNELFQLLAPLALIAFAVTGGAAAIAGEEANGTMSLLSAQPVSRAGIVAAKALAQLVTVTVVAFALWATVSLGAAVFGIDLGPSHVAAACLHLLLLALLFGALALAVGAATGRPDLASGVAGGVAVAAYLTNALLPLAGLDRWARLSPWYYYAGSKPLNNGVDLLHLLVLGALLAVTLTLAVRAFPARDLRG